MDPAANIAASGFCDLHAHSTASDGTDTPTQLAHEGARVGLKALALTDHDTTAGLEECAAACADLGIEFVPGIEFSCDLGAVRDTAPSVPTGVLHILGLFVRHDDPALLALCEQQRDRRNEHIPRMLAALARLGMPVTMEEVAAISGGQVLGRMHVAGALLARGYVQTVGEAFKKYIGTGGPANPPREFVHPRDAITAIHDAGGIAVLAHPVQLRCPDVKSLCTTIWDLKKMGLRGLEVYHPDHAPAEAEQFIAVARFLHLRPSGGSDYHGRNKAVELGSQRVPLYFRDRLRPYQRSFPLPHQIEAVLKQGRLDRRQAVRDESHRLNFSYRGAWIDLSMSLSLGIELLNGRGTPLDDSPVDPEYEGRLRRAVERGQVMVKLRKQEWLRAFQVLKEQIGRAPIDAIDHAKLR